nr:MAG TPA: hypothetical protein [Caudoviricetes sp.]
MTSSSNRHTIDKIWRHYPVCPYYLTIYIYDTI